MTEFPVATAEQATPAQWIERLEIFRERFRLGLLNESQFKEISSAFQFTDTLGHLWMPGATTNQWYRWDRTKWSAASPPAQLGASNLPLAISISWGKIPAPPALSQTQVPPSTAPIQTPPPPRVQTPTAPPRRPEPRARPSDVPERGRTRGPSKPTDLPR